MSNIRSIIKETIKKEGKTFQEVADEMGIKRVSLSTMLLHGNPNLSNLLKLSNILNKPLMFGGVEIEFQKKTD